MKHLLILGFWVATLGGLYEANGQNTSYLGWFPTLDLSGRVADRWNYNLYLFDAIKLYSNDLNGVRDDARSFFIYGEAGISYQFTDRLSATVAYVHERQNPFRDDYRIENRFFQQLTLQLPVGEKSILKQRLRFDERFIGNRLTNETPFTHRLRYLIGFKHFLIQDHLYMIGYSEFFFNTSNRFKFDENWSALQLGIPLNPWNSIEVGLLFVGWIKNAQNDWLNQYYFQTTWVWQLDFL